MLHDKTLTVQGLYTEPSQQLTNNNLNYTRHINRTRINQRNNVQLGDFLLPALQSTSAAGPSTSVYRTTLRPTPTRSNFTSNNRAFPSITQNLFRMGQLTHHIKNWERVPASISNKINDLVLDIHPPLNKELLTAQLTEHARTFGNKIKETITEHLHNELSNVTDALNLLNPADVKEASKLACTRLRTRLGNKFHRHSLIFSDFEKEVGKHYSTNEIADVNMNRSDNSNQLHTNELTNPSNTINVVTDTADSANIIKLNTSA